MQIEVLSSAGGRSSGYLLRHDGTTVLVDCGPGTAVAVARGGWLDQLDAVVITHQHADHAADLIGLAYARRFPDPMPEIPLLAPLSALDVLHRLDDLFAVPTLPQMASTIAASFNPSPLSVDGTPVPIAGHLRLASYPAAHAVPSAALRFSTEQESVTFSSDTGTCAALIEAARLASLFLCEATYLDASPAELQHHGHLTPQLAATTAADAGARRLVLTHLARPADAPTAIAIAGQHFHTAPITVATPGTTITMTPTGQCITHPLGRCSPDSP